jgi:phosphoglycerate dehydrogenase-like enzyme
VQVLIWKEGDMQEIVVLSTMRFADELLDKLRAVSPRLMVKQCDCRSAEKVEQALEEDIEVLYAAYLPLDLSRALRLKWVQMHVAGIDDLLDHPIMKSDILSANRICENQAASGACQTEGTNSNFSVKSVAS